MTQTASAQAVISAQELGQWILEKMILLATIYYPLTIATRRLGWVPTGLTLLSAKQEHDQVELVYRLGFRRYIKPLPRSGHVPAQQ